MNAEHVHIENDSQILNYTRVLDFFKDNSNVLNVTISKNDTLDVDFSLVNKSIDNMSSLPNLYAIYTMNENKIWLLRYIGQRKSKDIKQRLRQHLKKRHINTGSQLDKVKSELNLAVQVGIKLVSIRPDELRHYYEEKLLNDLSTDWNRQR